MYGSVVECLLAFLKLWVQFPTPKKKKNKPEKIIINKGNFIYINYIENEYNL